MDRIINITLISCVIILITILTFEFLNSKEGLAGRFPYPLITSICALYFIKMKRARLIQQNLEQKD
ncbi:hypothetical protein SAMN05421820_101805 [Pedobacter steynii]|uniref:Uncharacterized protein n=1 Tax=Pedobacter steynii TaxID=430522 RepID=A0A1G9L835_9SPHI|nr:hypothetical protein SAMN05421820_101805 [Pedobacter steynii]